MRPIETAQIYRTVDGERVTVNAVDVERLVASGEYEREPSRKRTEQARKRPATTEVGE